MDLAGSRPGRPERRGQAAAQAVARVTVVGGVRAAARSVSGPLLHRQGRYASQATAASGRP